jgi:hypothetical protein
MNKPILSGQPLRPWFSVLTIATILRLLLIAVALSTISIPLILHNSLTIMTADCVNGGDQGHAISHFLTSTNHIPTGFNNSNNSNHHSQSSSKFIKYTLDYPPDYYPPHTIIIHTVLTRFMVGQASQYTLADARYLLFETFCYPTMKYQTNQNFYWLILVDPGLDQRILDKMTTLLQTMPTQNAFMVMTNNTSWASDGIGVENATSYGVELRTVAEEFEKGTVDIVTGNTTCLQQVLHQMDGTDNNNNNSNNNNNQQSTTSPKPIIMAISTLLDADDGLNNHGVEWIQKIAWQRVKEQQHYLSSITSTTSSTTTTTTTYTTATSMNLNNTWWFLCGTDHIEWHNRDIFRLSNEEYAKTGLSSGLVGIRSNPYFCTSAGFTRIGLTQPPTTMTFPQEAYSNHALAFYFPPCTVAEEEKEQEEYNYDYATTWQNSSVLSRCWRREFPGRPFIVKSRTIGSDSMDNMSPTDHYYRDVSWLNMTQQQPLRINETERTWEILIQDFSISRRAAWTTSIYLYEYRKQILQDNRSSRCTPGFPCYKVAKKNLISLERFVTRQEGKQKQPQFHPFNKSAHQ